MIPTSFMKLQLPRKSSRTTLIWSSFLMFLLMSCASPQHKPAESKQFDVYLLAGQSNMDGLGLVAELPNELRSTLSAVPIYNPNRTADEVETDPMGHWESLQPGHGSGYGINESGSVYSDKFGIELTFARRMLELNPNQRIALFKYAKGGASIHPDAANLYGSWHPEFEKGNGINQWDHFQFHYRRAMAVKDIDGDGIDDILRPAGILWLQGESDAVYAPEIAEQYLENLHLLMDVMRREVGIPDLPVVISRISESNMGENGILLTYGSVVQNAQASFADNDLNAAYIDPPKGHGWVDPWHYDSQTYIDLGKRFADAMFALKKPPTDK